MNVDIDCSNERKIIETPHKTIYKNGRYIVPNSALIVYNKDNSYKLRKSIYIQNLLKRPTIFYYGNCIDTENIGSKYKIEEFLGIDLLEYLLKNAITIKSIPFLFRKICEQVKILHDQDIVHGDLKYENIIIIGNDLILIDFDESFVERGSDKNHGLSIMDYDNEIDYENEKYLLNTIEEPLGIKYNKKIDIYALGIMLLFFYLKLYNPDKFITNYILLQQSGESGKYSVVINDGLINELSTREIQNFLTKKDIVEEKGVYDLLINCLTEDYQIRFSIDDILSHPYLNS